MILTDTHIHLYADEFSADRKELMTSAFDKNIHRFFLPNIDSTSVNGLLDLQQEYPDNCFPMMGLHPCYVKENYIKELSLVEKQLANSNFVAVGEIGIDLYWDKTFEEEQKTAFVKQITWASELNLPVSIHSRNATDVVLFLLKENSHLHTKGILHCFSGTAEQAQQAVEMGLYLGIGGVITYKNSGLDTILKNIDIKHLVLETDAPYLPPTPHRGKRNQPSYITYIAEKLALIKDCSFKEIVDETTSNSKIIFNK